jgi:galactokinase
MKKINMAKLAILLDEEEILKNFGRSRSNWVRPIKPDIRREVVYSIKNRSNVLENGLDNLILKSVPKSKSYSANMSRLPTYVEFRCMGGNYSERFDECHTTIRHYAECIEAACDPDMLSDVYTEKLVQFKKSIDKEIVSLKEREEKAKLEKLRRIEEALNRDNARVRQRIRNFVI